MAVEGRLGWCGRGRVFLCVAGWSCGEVLVQTGS